MALVMRQKSNRRFDLPVKFPLTDCQGIAVIQDRRRLPDRRKAAASLIDLMIVLSKKITD